MKNTNRLASGRVVVKTPSEVALDRYQFLDLSSAEPNLGTASNGSVLTTDVNGQRIWTANISITSATASGNLKANAVYTENLFYANGQPFITGAIENPSNIYNGRATAGNTQTLIDSFNISGVDTVRWVLSAVDSVNSAFKTSTIDSSNDGTNIFYNEFGVVLSDNNNEVANYTVDIVGSQVRLYATGTSASVPVTFQRTTLGSSTTVGNVQGISYSSNSLGSGTATTVVVDNFVGNGSTTSYPLSTAPATKNQTLIAIGGILQPKSTYNLSGSTITFSSAPPSGAPIEIQTFVLTTITGYTGSAGTGGGGGGNGYTGSRGFTGSAGTNGAVGFTGSIGYTGSTGTFSGTTSQPIITTNTTASTSTSTGALQVAGGAGIGGRLYVGGDIFVTGNILPTSNNTVNLGSPTNRFDKLYIAAQTIDLGGQTQITSDIVGQLQFVTNSGNVTLTANAINFLQTVANSTTASGDITAIGNIVASQNLTVSGNLTVQGNTIVVNSQDFAVKDSTIAIHTPADLSPLISNDGKDIGLTLHYYDTGDKQAFFGRKNTTNRLVYYQDATESSGNVFTGTLGTFEIGSVYANSYFYANGTPYLNTGPSGATGPIGFTGSQGATGTFSGTTSQAIVTSNTTPATSTTTGALRVAGGASVQGALYVGGDLRVSGNIIGGFAFVVTKADFPGTLTVFNGTNRFYCFTNALITQLQFYALTAPTGSAATARLNLNGTPVANISLGSGTTYVSITGLSISTVSGDYLTVDITAIGSSFPGADASLQIIGVAA